MAGSLTWREYESDHGVIYSIKIDKSNALLSAATSGEALCNVRGFTWSVPPKGLILRRVHCFSQLNRKHKRSFIVGNKKVLNTQQMAIGQEYIANGTGVWSWIITGYTGEKFTVPQYINQLDGGLTDGTLIN